MEQRLESIKSVCCLSKTKKNVNRRAGNINLQSQKPNENIKSGIWDK